MQNSLTLSPITVGFWRLAEAQLTDEQLYAFVVQCLEQGITTFDHADIYGGGQAQIQFGRVLKQHPHLREQMTIVSKCGIVRNPEDQDGLTPSYYNTSYEYILNQVDLILDQLHLDYLDVLLIHRVDHLMDYGEFARAFRDLKTQNKVRHFGVSNFLVPQLDAMMKVFPELVLNQIQISVDHLEHFKNGVLERCQYYGLQVMAYSPLGGGEIFKDHYPNIKLIEKLREIQAELSADSMDQVMLAWLLKHPLKIHPIVGSMKIERVLSSLQATSMEMSHQQWYELYTHSQLERMP